VVAYLVVAVVPIVVPGQDTALTIRNAVAGGRRGGVATAAGLVALLDAVTGAVLAAFGIRLAAER
jgi:threonine/homoserine/homoserine lactone efflux protein